MGTVRAWELKTAVVLLAAKNVCKFFFHGHNDIRFLDACLVAVASEKFWATDGRWTKLQNMY